MAAQKVLRVGKSAAVTIPKGALKELRWKIGDNVYLHADLQRRVIHVSKKRNEVIEPLSERERELLEWIENFVERYRKDLDKLRKS